jgi:nitrite reductase/ring-hydroxylating ferredoxin subunit
MPADTYEEPHWRDPNVLRTRCLDCGKVVFRDARQAQDSADKILARAGRKMYAYQGKCGHWHLSRSNKKPRSGKRRNTTTY